METKKHKGVRLLLVTLTGLLVLIIAGLSFGFVHGKMKESNYFAALDEAKKYVAESDYEQAILQYQKAISVIPERPDAYLDLAELYEGQENASRAVAVLRKGYKKTNSAKIRRRLRNLEVQLMLGKITDGDPESGTDPEQASKDLAWNTSFLQKAVNFTFEDYKREFGKVVDAKVDEEGYLQIRHEKLAAVCYYANTEDNPEIVDMSRRLPYPTGMPEKMVVDSLELMLRNFGGSASLYRMQMLFGERVRPQGEEGLNYIESSEEDLVIRIETDEEGNILSGTAGNELFFPLANQRGMSSEVLFSGVVIDALSGQGIAGASLEFETAGSSLTAVTDSSGAFLVGLRGGDYEIIVRADGYIVEEFHYRFEKGGTYSGEQFVLSPELAGEARIVLEWGAHPRDLDSHLTGSPDGGQNIHVFFGQRSVGSGSGPIAELDLDDMNGYGPETTTIYNLDGVYTFSVEDFQKTGDMAAEGARVKIYLPGQDPVTISLSASSGVGNVWEVCRIDHGRLEILNRAGSEN